MATIRFDVRAGRKILLILDLSSLILILALVESMLRTPQTLLFEIVWVLTTLAGLYLSGRYNEAPRYLGSQIARVAAGFLLSMIVSYPFLSGVDVSRVLLLLVLFIVNVFVLSLIVYAKAHFKLIAKAHIRKILVLTDSNSCPSRYEELETQLETYGHQLEWKPCSISTEEDVPDFDLWDIVVYEDTASVGSQLPIRLLEEKIKGRKIIDFVSFYSIVMGRIPLDLVDESMLLKTGRNFFENKPLLRLMRLIDLVAGLVLGVLTFVPMILIAIVIRVESSGPVIFRQERLGRNMKPFVLYKFRSMSSGAEQNGPQWAALNDRRATRVGGILRKSHLDELPQIINLLRGDISLIGPRPIRKYFADQLVDIIPYYHLRFLIKPGLTGWAQVRGPYGADQAEQRIKHEMDLFYIQNASIPLNLHLLVSTCRVMGGVRWI